MRPWFAIFLVLLALPLPVQAAGASSNATSAGALPLTAERPSASDTLIGNGAGAFRYYRFDHPGGGNQVTLTLDFSPTRSELGYPQFGFNVYGPQGLTAQADGSETQMTVDLLRDQATSYLLQVYNYQSGRAAAFKLTAGGLGETKAARANDTADAAIELTRATTVLAQELAGRSGGAARYYRLVAPGGASQLTVTLTYAPYPRLGTGAVGFNLYRNGTLVASGVEQSRGTSEVTLTATVPSRGSAVYLLQVTNHSPGDTLRYRFTAWGLGSQPTQATTNTVPEKALALTGGASYSATTTGSPTGAFSYYTLQYPGADKALTVVVTYPSPGGAPATALGFNVYHGSRLLAEVRPSLDETGLLTAVWTYSASEPAALTIQVMNYGSGSTVSHTIHASGVG